MDKLILIVNEYPFTSFCVFLGCYILLAAIGTIVEDIFIKSKKQL